MWQINYLTLAYTGYYYKRDGGLDWNQGATDCGVRPIRPMDGRTDEWLAAQDIIRDLTPLS